VDPIRSGRRHRPRCRDRGTATAETAVALPVLAVLLLVALWSVNVVVLQLRCVDAAGTAARALARGEPVPLVRADARRVAPEGAVLGVEHMGRMIAVEVRVTARLPGPWRGAGPGVELRGRAVAVAEDTL
jgi:hypothetical protein